MHVAHGGRDAVMAQEALQRGQSRAGFQEMGGKAVALMPSSA
jgi:hypothetical protein